MIQNWLVNPSGKANSWVPVDLLQVTLMVNERDRQRAGRIIERYQQRQGNGWLCGQCGEENGANFDICWRCHHDPQDH